jgi:diguanylate cyclase (GGDEF)-like protein
MIEAPAEAAAPRRLARSNDFAGRKVLIVDDDPPNIALIQEGLAGVGYSFLAAHDGAQALVRVRDDRPDLILMDVEMPGLNGVDVCRIVKANQGDAGFGFIPVILMTARAGNGKVEGLELGADDYLVKPLAMLELSARVKSMLRLKILQDELIGKYKEVDRINRDLEKKSYELERLSRMDPLTALFNRRYFEERFAAEFARSNRYRVPLTCLMIDVDHFKKVNDTFGHQMGDRALKDVAAIIRGTLRDVDLIARYGGEEMVAILPETGPQEGRHVAERLRQAVAGAVIEQAERRLSVTVSIGLASYPVPGIEDHEAFLRAADEALYRAKEGGRDCVRAHEE